MRRCGYVFYASDDDSAIDLDGAARPLRQHVFASNRESDAGRAFQEIHANNVDQKRGATLDPVHRAKVDALA